MGNFYSKKSKAPTGPAITEVDRAILSLKTQRKKLEDQEKLLNMRLGRHAEVASQLAKEGRRDRALLVLKKKKLSEKQLVQLHGLILNVEEMLSSIEITKKQSAVFATLQSSTAALKQLQAQVKLEDVQRLLDDTAEAKQYQEELASLLGQQLSDVESSEVEAELAALEEVVADEKKLEMPRVPTTKITDAEKARVQEATAPTAATPEKGEAAVEEPQREAMLAS
ncbi:hypothetical protein Vretimale_18960 [Volvox reticuliferus]|uniref:Uncharacterized protein n=1 Tax=Volvox reticuliferus TaxID=1737510 RepID=A0A8J4GVX5_9CHLO|nr:hypothetical protein Vretifemale_20065 [Volvox reticuliferus]GIM16329.1 hypothetical protein Vretimale_18960 [Volvox reticuliferus]